MSYGDYTTSSPCGSQAVRDSMCGDPIHKVFIKQVGVDAQRSQLELGLIRLTDLVDTSYDVTTVAQLMQQGRPFSHPLEASPFAAPHRPGPRPAYPAPHCTCLRRWVTGPNIILNGGLSGSTMVTTLSPPGDPVSQVGPAPGTNAARPRYPWEAASNETPKKSGQSVRSDT